jgi:hypothetical protein
VSSWSALVALNGGASAFVAQMRSQVGARYSTGHVALEPGTLVKSASSADVYVVDGLNRKVGVPDFAVTRELGLGQAYSTVTQGTLDGYARSAANLSLLVRCGGTSYLATQGSIVALANPGSTGLPVTDLVPTTCRTLDATGGTVTGSVLVKSAADPSVYVLQGGQARPVSSWAKLVALAGTSSPTITTMGASALARIPVGAAY